MITTLKVAIQDNFFQSPHCTTIFFQHVYASDQGKIVCKSCATHQDFITSNMVHRYGSAIKFERAETAYYFSLISLAESINRWRRGRKLMFSVISVLVIKWSQSSVFSIISVLYHQYSLSSVFSNMNGCFVPWCSSRNVNYYPGHSVCLWRETVSRVSNQNGVSRLYIIVEIYHCGLKPLVWSVVLSHSFLQTVDKNASHGRDVCRLSSTVSRCLKTWLVVMLDVLLHFFFFCIPQLHV